MDLNGSRYAVLDTECYRYDKFEFQFMKKSIFRLNDIKIQNFIKQNHSWVIYLKIVDDIDAIYQLVILVECVISKFTSTKTLWTNIICIYIENKYEKTIEINC
jgi:hypothetical protein